MTFQTLSNGSRPRRRVIKLGGSLLDDRMLARRFAGWRAMQPPAIDALVVGGGAMVEALRQADRCFEPGEALMHDLALRAMDITARLAQSVLAGAVLADGAALPPADAAPGELYILCARTVCEWAERARGAPRSWSLTSDSIAALAAARWPADELVLLKSSLPADSRSAEALVESAYVDAWFGRAIAEVTVVRFVNLRDERFSQILLG